MLFFMMCLSPHPFMCILMSSCLFLWHVDPSLCPPPRGPLPPPFPFISFCPWLKISWCLHETSLMCSISSVTCNPALPTVLTHILSLLHLYFSISSSSCFMLGPVCTGGDGQSGGRAGQAQGKSSSSLGGTSSRQGLRPPCVPAVSTVPSPQQFNQGNTAPTL